MKVQVTVSFQRLEGYGSYPGLINWYPPPTCFVSHINTKAPLLPTPFKQGVIFKLFCCNHWDYT